MISKILNDNPKMSINEIVRTVWKLDIDINVTSIIRTYFTVCKDNIKPKSIKVKLIKIPNNLDHSKKLLLQDMVRHGCQLSFRFLRNYGFTVEDIEKIEKENGWARR